MIITPERLHEINALARERKALEIDPDRQRELAGRERMRQRMQARKLEFPLPEGPLVVIMSDDIQHTVDFPTCADPTCVCHLLEQERIQAELDAAKPKRRRQVTRTTSPKLKTSGPAISAADRRRYDAPYHNNEGFRIM